MENFLHSFVIRGLDQESNDFFNDMLSDKYKACPRAMFIQLMNQKDIWGQTPFYLCLDSQELTLNTVGKLIDHGADINVQDQLGNTVLHRITALSLGNCEQVVKLLCSKGANLNLINRNKQSICSMIQDKQLGILDVFLANKADIVLSDRWNRNIPMIASKFQDRHLVKNIIEKCLLHSHRDRFGATALHWAAFTDNIYMIDELIATGVDINDVDLNGYTALDIAILFERKGSILRLKDANHSLDQTIYSRVNAQEELEMLPKTIKSDDLNRIDELIPVSVEMADFVASLLSSGQVSRPEISNEIKKIQEQVKDFVENVCIRVGKYDQNFSLSVFQTGSVADGTKIGPPDEFDFAICLDKFSDMCEVVEHDASEETTQDSAFVRVWLSDEYQCNELMQYCDENWMLNSWPLLQKLFFLLRRGLFETGQSSDGNLFFKFEKDLIHLSSKPVFNATFVWVGHIYKELVINVDLVPALRKPGWWPKYKDMSNVRMNETARTAGCLILLQAKISDEEGLIICGLDDFVDAFGRQDPNSVSEIDHRTLLRISTSPAEIVTMQSFPSLVRDSYMLSKVLVKCIPELLVNTDTKPEKVALKMLGIKFKEPYIAIKAERFISSYMLKNCVFHVMAALDEEYHGVDDAIRTQNIGLLGLTVLVFKHLLQRSEDIFLPAYFLPFVDVFSFEELTIYKPDPTFLLSRTISRRHRLKMLITIILHIVGVKT